ncbi:MAG: pyrroline-5-carboxylate reductase [Clostridiales Family XIII bacterium]|jgi:pyrroline-5-carboxylate reductase|nr:pyrroline-5-carboxylate reductase [Clostridiales Family XIII bacterium]
MKIGFIGVGNMGKALINGLMPILMGRNEYLIDIIAFDIDSKKIPKKIKYVDSMEELVLESDIIYLAIKPDVFNNILPKIAKIIDFRSDKIFISIAAGISISYLEKKLGKDKKIVRMMPNLPVTVGEGMIGVSFNEQISNNEKNIILNLVGNSGSVLEVNESLMDIVVGISGSSPAYVFKFIKALINEAKKYGMDEKLAKNFACQAVMGSAIYASFEDDLDKLIKNVCSKGGTTEQAVFSLDNDDFENTVQKAVREAVEKSKEITKE